ncbi:MULTISPECIES: pentapeptide repeat-containing protein [unclassified Nodularia (in: cyanobacteria)]|uniref:pentapeptide repeat-containing protein n=1 Tax=unclassified Nodularia (in: cyanobacteria) TaxID=2656917 RepID=UPI00188057A2|nr:MULTISPECIES: pentapeptide repeat-containing protein [unclassified Nodularia (in: cyanobacteria)]MBE9200758.1 pentapeptide repeat-containing protein [Nodularia sp. LEGE 06071]MCC2692077.1 pentapeptide repeat-containing protein [Nodularia sp. LEGE 04288]
MSLNVELLEQSFDKIKPRANEFAASFYENLFQAHPEVKPLFTHTDMGNQEKKLLNSLVLVVENLRNPEALGPVLNALGGRHVGYGAIPKYYGPVGEALLLTFEQYLEEDWTPEVNKAWLNAYRAITALMLKGAGVDYAPTQVKSEIAANSKQPVATKPIEQKIKEIPQVETAEPILTEIPEEESSELPVDLLESTFAKVKPRANEFAASFYENLFETHPEVKPLFTHTDMGNQEKKLLNSLVLVVENLRNPEALGPVLNALGGRHVGYGAIPKYYRPVGEALLLTFEQYLEADWTPEVNKAWLNAYRAITALMLKGAEEESSPKVIQAEKPAVLPKPVQVEKPVIVSKPATLKTQIQKESQLFQPSAELEKKSLISIQLDGEVLKEIINNFTANYQKFQTKISEQPISEVLKQLPAKLIDAFWIAPVWLVAIGSAVIFTVVLVIVDDNSLLAEVLGAADTISLVVALVLFIKEAPDRRKQFHYQAWGTVDAAHDVKVSYARILALQDLNEDGVSLRGLDAPGAELVDINLSHANLSKANLMESDLTNANLSYANLDNANLSQVKLSGANLSHAKLGFSRLIKANLNSANLSNANLICADLSDANLNGANLRDASLSGANLAGAYLTGANLKNAKVSDYELNSAFLEGAIMPDGSKYKSVEDRTKNK